jgi:parvulin-like peptidyl-prolyl isomerase
VVGNSVRHIFVLFFAALVFAAAGCGGSGSDGVPKDAVAVVGDETVSKQELNKLLEQTRASAKQSRRPFPKQGTAQYRQIRDQLVQYLVRRAQLAAEARDRDIEVSDEEIEQRQKMMVATYFGGNEKRYRERLAKQGLTEEQARADLEVSLLQQELLRDVGKDVNKNVKVTDAEVRKHYAKNKAKYGTPARREIRQILLGANQRALAQRVVDQLRAGASFAQLARRHSKDPRAKSAGGRFVIAQGDASRMFDRVVFSVPQGRIEGPLMSQFGWHVIEALGPVRRGKATPYPQVKEQIRQELLQERRSRASSKFLTEVARKKNVEYQAGFGPSA